MNDTDIINDRLAEMRRARMEKEEEARNRPRKTIAEMMQEAVERDAEQGIVREPEVKDKKPPKAEKPKQSKKKAEKPTPITQLIVAQLEKSHLSKYRGVCYHKETSQWKTTIKIKGEIMGGYFMTEMGAAKEYDRLAIKFNKEKAITNFPINECKILDDSISTRRQYSNVDVVISSERIRRSMEVWIASKPPKYRARRANWVIFADLFYPDHTPQDIFEICESMDISHGDLFL